MAKMQFIDLQAQYSTLKDNINSRIQKVLDHGSYIMGPEVFELEEKLADFVGSKHCVTCANGTDALQLVLLAQGIGAGDAVFAPAFTFFATAEVIALVGATPIFVDVEPDTFNISAEKLLAAISRVKSEGMLNPKAIISVDLFGLPADYTKIEKIAKNHSLLLIEDGAQGFGGAIGKKRACSFGDVATTSFFPAKPLGCYGDGGALFTNDDELARILRSLRIHGQGVDKYDNVLVGLNSRLDTLQAAILLEKLECFPAELVARQEIANLYSNTIHNADLRIPAIPDGFSSSWAQFTLLADSTETRSVYLQKMKDCEIPSAVYYRKTLDLQPALADISIANDLFVSHSLAERVFSLPMHPYLTEKDVAMVVEAISE